MQPPVVQSPVVCNIMKNHACHMESAITLGVKSPMVDNIVKNRARHMEGAIKISLRSPISYNHPSLPTPLVFDIIKNHARHTENACDHPRCEITHGGQNHCYENILIGL